MFSLYLFSPLHNTFSSLFVFSPLLHPLIVSFLFSAPSSLHFPPLLPPLYSLFPFLLISSPCLATNRWNVEPECQEVLYLRALALLLRSGKNQGSKFQTLDQRFRFYFFTWLRDEAFCLIFRSNYTWGDPDSCPVILLLFTSFFVSPVFKIPPFFFLLFSP
jgi:hypothetical protein